MFMTKKDRKIKNQNAMIKNRNELIKEQKEENHCLYEEKKKLEIENEEQKELLAEIAQRAFSCPLDSEKIVLSKIKELVRNYQSQN